MSQVKIFGIDKRLIPIRDALSDVIHSCVMEALGMPKDKRAHRFIPIEKENFFMPHFQSDHPESSKVCEEIEYCKSNNIEYKSVPDGDVLVF